MKENSPSGPVKPPVVSTSWCVPVLNRHFQLGLMFLPSSRLQKCSVRWTNICVCPEHVRLVQMNIVRSRYTHTRCVSGSHMGADMINESKTEQLVSEGLSTCKHSSIWGMTLSQHHHNNNINNNNNDKGRLHPHSCPPSLLEPQCEISEFSWCGRLLWTFRVEMRICCHRGQSDMGVFIGELHYLL